MGEVQLGYGRSSLSFTFEENRYDILSDNRDDPQPLTDIEIGAALDAPIASPPLDEICSASDTVLIVVSDGTRATDPFCGNARSHDQHDTRGPGAAARRSSS